MEKGNVLIIGNSGVGKSTLINAVLGEEMANTGWGTEGTTKGISVYESVDVPFRLIDTAGLEPSILKQNKVIKEIKRWSKKSTKEGYNGNQINVIWFCIDGTSRKLFLKTIKNLSKSISMWKTVPVIVVITKSYSIPERKDNITMVKEAFNQQEKNIKNLSKIIPVVAETFVINENAYAAPEGITELTEVTNELMPEGIKASKVDIATFQLKRKRVLAQGVVGVSTTTAAVVGAIPIPFPDATILTPIETALINGLAHIYQIKKKEDSKYLLSSIIEVSAVGMVAKTAVNTLKVIPGLTLGASVINAIVAGSIVASLGEGSIFVFEQVYLGKKSVSDADWVKSIIQSNFSSDFIEIVKTIGDKVPKGADSKTVSKIVLDVFKHHFRKQENVKS